jgi:hypothetical protein
VFGVQVRLGREEPEYIDLGKPGETDTGSVCDIVVRENIAIRSVTTPTVRTGTFSYGSGS